MSPEITLSAIAVLLFTMIIFLVIQNERLKDVIHELTFRYQSEIDRLEIIITKQNKIIERKN